MKKILVVDDEALITKMLQLNLKKHGYNCLVEQSGYKAIETIESENIDLMITDVMMPEMDGFTLAKRVHEINPDIPILFLSANKMEESMDHALNNDGSEYFTKPFNIKDILDAIGRYLH